MTYVVGKKGEPFSGGGTMMLAENGQEGKKKQELSGGQDKLKNGLER
jgi:hypothetical protein